MGTTTLTVKYINPPKPGSQRGSIKGTDGTTLGVFPDKMKLFEIGQTYTVEFTDGQYQNVRSAKPQFVSGAYRGEAPAPGTPTPALPHKGGGAPNNTYRETCPADAERMFTCAVLTAFIKAGELKNDKQALWDTTNMLRQLWHHSFGTGAAAATLPKKNCRDVYAKLQAEIDGAESAAALAKWKEANAGRVMVLPTDWQLILSLRLEEKLGELRQRETGHDADGVVWDDGIPPFLDRRGNFAIVEGGR